LRASLHDLQRTGSLNPFCWKNSCSPTVNMKLPAQSLHLISLSSDTFYPLGKLIHFCGNTLDVSNGSFILNQRSFLSGIFQPILISRRQVNQTQKQPIHYTASLPVPYPRYAFSEKKSRSAWGLSQRFHSRRTFESRRALRHTVILQAYNLGNCSQTIITA
jgi:hypothetical protein